MSAREPDARAQEVGERPEPRGQEGQRRLALLVAFSILHVKGQIAFFVLVLVVLVVCPPEALGEPQAPEVCLLLLAILREEALGHHLPFAPCFGVAACP